MRKVAFLIAASPTDAFYSQVAALRARLQTVAWTGWQASIHVFLGGDRRSDPVHGWLPYLEDVDIARVSEARFAEQGDWAQSDDAFRHAPRDADVLVALDADTFVVGEFETVLDRVHGTGAVAGVIAHYPPEHGLEFDDAAQPVGIRPGHPSLRDTWNRLAHDLVRSPLDFAYAHTLMGAHYPADDRVTPFYVNFGVVAFSRDVFDEVAPRYLAIRPRAADRMSSPDFSGQVALALAIADAGVRTWALPMRYNFPNYPLADRMYPDELAHAAIIHYLWTGRFDRHRIFTSADEYAAFLALDLSGSNGAFRDAVEKALGRDYPFPRTGASAKRQT